MCYKYKFREEEAMLPREINMERTRSMLPHAAVIKNFGECRITSNRFRDDIFRASLEPIYVPAVPISISVAASDQGTST